MAQIEALLPNLPLKDFNVIYFILNLFEYVKGSNIYSYLGELSPIDAEILDSLRISQIVLSSPNSRTFSKRASN